MDFKTKISMYLLTMIVGVFANAQEKKLASPRESATGKISESTITVDYGSPSVKGRMIWGELVPFGKVWRAGANEATTFETSKDVLVAGQKLPAGKYAFFLIPEKDKVTVVFNKEAKQWGAYDYDSKKDQLRVDVKPTAKSDKTEKLEYKINKQDVTLNWDSWSIVIPVK
ncbi:MAG TPA: DUF2911 domain-containing protein [Flavobacterium sp.]|nr:DUF2911 domain-containing protein [Flavobacterium sp.]